MKLPRLTLALLVLCSAAVCAEDDLSTLARAYLQAHSQPSADSKWERALESRTATGLNDNPALNAESFSNTALQDYLLSVKGRCNLDAKAPKLPSDVKVELCRWYLVYRKKQWTLPSHVAPYVNLENFKRWIAGETAAVAK